MKHLPVVLIVLLVLGVIAACSPYDSTDEPGGQRSGMRLHTDSLTGCQYLSIPLGGLTPRVDGAGRHVGCKR